MSVSASKSATELAPCKGDFVFSRDVKDRSER